MIYDPIYKSAKFSNCRTHRYELKRTWDTEKPTMVIIGLNPSTADEYADDPTIRRCISFAQREGCGRLLMLNLFSYRATDPKELKALGWHDLTNDCKNTTWVKTTCKEVFESGGTIVAAWGTHGRLHREGAHMKLLLGDYQVFCFGHTKDGHPKHPLYLPKDVALERWCPWRYER